MKHNTELILNGYAGKIEARYLHNPNPHAPIALVFHPSPLHGGTMNNRLTKAIFNAFAVNDFSVVRFNFRGVGRSDGVHDYGDGELMDAAAILDWMKSVNPGARRIWVGGFAFGAFVAMQLLMRRPEFDGFICVSPPANLYDFSFLAPCPSSGLIVSPSDDVLCPADPVEKMVARLQAQRGISVEHKIIQTNEHLYSDKMDELNDIFKNYIGNSEHDMLDHVKAVNV